MTCFLSEECQPGGLGWGWSLLPDTPHSAGCLPGPVRTLLSPGDSHVLPHAAAPSCLELDPPALGRLSNGPAEGECRTESIPVFCLRSSALFVSGHESVGKLLFSLLLQQEGTRRRLLETSIPMNSRLTHHGPSEGLRTDTKMNSQAGKGR